LQRNKRCFAAGMNASLPMTDYSSEELDLMAEAYNRLAHRLPPEGASTETTMRLVEAIGAGVAKGVRDAAALASDALKRAGVMPGQA
jgi:hypothetical protein